MNQKSKLLISFISLLTLTGCSGNTATYNPSSTALNYSQLKKLATDGTAIANTTASIKMANVKDNSTYPFSNLIAVTRNDSSYTIYNPVTGEVVTDNAITYGQAVTDLYYTYTNNKLILFVESGAIVKTYDATYLFSSPTFSRTSVSSVGYILTVSYLGNNAETITDTLYVLYRENNALKLVTQEEFIQAETEYESKATYTSMRDIGFDCDNFYCPDTYYSGVSIYDANKNYIGYINYPLSYSYLAASKTKLAVFGSTTYQSPDKQAATIHSYCYVIDIKTTAATYYENLPYVVNSNRRYYDENGYVAGTYLTISPLNDDKTSTLPFYEIYDFTGDVNSCAKYQYDPAVSYTYTNLADRALLSNNQMLIDKKSRTPITDSFLYVNKDYVMQYEDSKYSLYTSGNYLDKLSPIMTHGSVSWNTVNNEHIYYDYDKVNAIYNGNNGYTTNQNFSSLISKGIFVNDKSINLVGGDTLLFTEKIKQISYVTSNNDTTLYSIAYENTNALMYFCYTANLD